MWLIVKKESNLSCFQSRQDELPLTAQDENDCRAGFLACQDRLLVCPTVLFSEQARRAAAHPQG